MRLHRLGTVAALTTSADINLVLDPQVRIAVLEYARRVELHLAEFSGLQRSLDAHASEIVIAWQADTGFEPEGLHAWLVERDDPRIKEAIAHLWLDGGNAVRILGYLQSATDELAQVLEGG